jgi:hypothetical protein
MLRGIKKGVGFTISITLGIFSIVLAAWGLLTFWGNMPVKVQYVIVAVERNDGTHECDAPFVTILKDVKTQSMDYRCGKLGRVHETKYLNKETHEPTR